MKRIPAVVLLVLFCMSCSRQVPILSHEVGTVIVNNQSEPETIDPALFTGHPDATVILQLFEGLTSFNPRTLEPVPGVAEEWDISPDGRVYTFHLRTTARWSDGNPVTARDFKYSLMRLLRPETGSRYAYQAYYIKNGESFSKRDIEDESALGIEVIDDHTLEITLESPTAYFLSLLFHPTLYPVRQDVVEKYGTDWTRPENIVGNGPFMLEKWQVTKEIVMKPNTYYWDRKNVKPKKLIFYPIENSLTAYKMYRADQIMITQPVPLAYVDKLIAEKDPELMVAPYFTTYFYKMNTTLPALKNKKIRKALSLVIDRNKIVEKILKAGQLPAWTLVPPETTHYNPPVPEYSKVDIPEAKKLLREGLAEENLDAFPETRLLYNTDEGHKKLALAITDMWREHLGLNIAPYNQEWKVFLKTENNMDYQIIRQGWVGDYLDPNTFLDLFVTNGGNNNTGWSNADYDRLIKSAAREQNPDERMELLEKAEAILIDEQPIIPLYFYVMTILRKPYLKGYHGNAMDLHNYKHASIDVTELNNYYKR